MLFMGKDAYKAASNMSKEKLGPMKEALIRIHMEDKKKRTSIPEILARRKREKEDEIDSIKKQFCDYIADSLNEACRKEVLEYGLGIPSFYVTGSGIEKIVDEYISKFGKTSI